MTKQEKEIFDFINRIYGNAEYYDDGIYYSDEDTNTGYKVTVEVTN